MHEPVDGIAYPNTIYVDLDGTLCPIKGEGERYGDLPVNMELVARLRRARADGFKIVVYTARNMRTYGGDIAQINAHTAPTILNWLARHDIPYDGLIVGKPWPGPRGFYVDDKALRPDEFIRMNDAQIQALIGNGD
ncbi:MAG TPA: capsular biosynthesis protein [Burkholderiaceae bacterium]